MKDLRMDRDFDWWIGDNDLDGGELSLVQGTIYSLRLVAKLCIHNSNNIILRDTLFELHWTRPKEEDEEVS